MRSTAISVAFMALLGSAMAYPAPQRGSPRRHTRIITKTVTHTVFNDITIFPSPVVTPTPTPTPTPPPAEVVTTTSKVEPERRPEFKPEPEPVAPSPAPAPSPPAEEVRKPIEADTGDEEEVVVVQPKPTEPAREPVREPVREEQPQAPSGGGASGFDAEILALHNSARAKHGVAPLAWDETIANYARKRSQTCVFAHDAGGYGENIAIGTDLGASGTMQMWYDDEEKKYNYANGGFSSGTGHFTQVVWKDTTKLGCGKTDCGGKGVFIVCNYDPPGNFAGRFQSNVPTRE